jgi:hypothetical protein
LFSNAALAAAKADYSTNKIGAIVEVLKKRLGIPNHVEIRIVDHDGLGASVQPADSNDSDFLISVDAGFLSQLDEDELTAALAHELGHVWIFTHHPFLHTEALANEIAMRAVTSDSLKKLYVKLGAFKGTAISYDVP